MCKIHFSPQEVLHTSGTYIHLSNGIRYFEFIKYLYLNKKKWVKHALSRRNKKANHLYALMLRVLLCDSIHVVYVFLGKV